MQTATPELHILAEKQFSSLKTHENNKSGFFSSPKKIKLG